MTPARGPVRARSRGNRFNQLAIRASKAFWQAIPAALLNPKTALFFLAFMPQFVHAEHGHALVQFLILGGVFSAMSIVYSGALAPAAVPIGRAARRLGWPQRWKGKIIGTIFIGWACASRSSASERSGGAKNAFVEREVFIATSTNHRAIFIFMTSRIAPITLSLVGEPRVL